MKARAGRLAGVGVGPGDPELITVKAVRALADAAVVAYFCARGKPSNARAIAAPHLRDGQTELMLTYPLTTEPAPEPGGYDAAMSAFYDESAQRIREQLDRGSNVAVLCEGDPFFYGSFMYLHDRLAQRYDTDVIPGVPSVIAAAARAGTPLVRRDETFTVLPGTLSEQRLHERLQSGGAFAVMKLGRNFGKVRAALSRAGMSGRACYVERATMTSERIARVDDVDESTVPYFSLVLLPSVRSAQSIGEEGSVTVVGLGPGADEWISPQARAALADATDLVGYEPYLDRVPASAGQLRHASDNRVEIERAKHALELARAGRRVCVVSSGDPGIFAMASAVMEAIDHGPAEWRSLDVKVVPGISAMQAAAARVGAPLGHDFCVISLSDRLKPWETIAQRLEAAAAADFAIALYNPLSSQRRHQFSNACAILSRHRDAHTPVLLARDLGGPAERVVTTQLSEIDASQVDMRTVVIVGSSRTRTIERPGAQPFMYTPRSYGGAT